MWSQKRGDKWRFYERVPLPGRKYKTISVTMEKNNLQTRKLAQQILAEKAGKLSDKDFTIDQIFAAYMRDQLRTVRPQTARRNETTLKNMVKLIGPKVKATELQAGHVRRILLAQDKPESWMNEYIMRFKAMMRWAYRNDFIDNTRCIDKLQKFALPVSAREAIQDKYMTSEELQAVIAALAPWPHWQLATKFLALTGLRFGEFAALLPEDFSSDYIHISRTYNATINVTNDPKTYSSIRDIAIQPELAEVIRDINLLVKKAKLKNPNIKKTPYWFPNMLRYTGKNGHISLYSFDKKLREITDEVIGRELTAHALRHTHASLLFQEGFTYDQVGRRLGHGGNSRVTREIYVHITSRLKEKDAAAIEKISLLG